MCVVVSPLTHKSYRLVQNKTQHVFGGGGDLNSRANTLAIHRCLISTLLSNSFGVSIHRTPLSSKNAASVSLLFLTKVIS